MAKWKVVKLAFDGGWFRVVSEGGASVYAGDFNLVGLPDAEQRAEKLRDELNERDAPKYSCRKGVAPYRSSVFRGERKIGYIDNEEAETFVALMNQSEGQKQEKEGQ